MKKDYWIKSICLIMVIVLFAGLITAADDSDEECDAALDVINSDLIMYKCLAVNRIIEEYCIGTKLTYEQKEIARLKRELRDTQDALDVLKKAIGILGKD